MNSFAGNVSALGRRNILIKLRSPCETVVCEKLEQCATILTSPRMKIILTQRHIYTKWQFTILRRQKNNVRIMTINPLINEMN